jgi:hypothetical protein
MNVKKIDEDRFWKLVAKLDLERAMGESVMQGPAMMQDEEIRESKREEPVEEELAAAVKAIESSTIGKGKGKAVPTRAKVYTEVEGPVSTLPS